MAAKTANLYARIEPDLKEQAESILNALGIPASNAIAMFYRQIVLHRGLPFEVVLPAKGPIDISQLTIEELHSELQKGYDDIESGNVTSAEEALARIRKEHNLI